jgi:putative pyruvate formate lyase activating enzyme
LAGETGYCGQTSAVRAARAALHFWEEPVLSGKNGSGAVFFSGCNLRCVFCQNYSIALGDVGRQISSERLSEIFFELKEKGAHNINLVTGTPFIPQIVKALERAKDNRLDIPVIFNCGGYENVSSIKMLDGLVDIYLPDMKYFSSELSSRYSAAPDYFERASEAIAEMYRQVGVPVFEVTSKKGQSSEIFDYSGAVLMKRGMIVRHLILPGQTKDSKKILRYLHETYGDGIYISIMNQYTPMAHITDPDSLLYNKYPELARKVTQDEYDRVVSFALKLGIEKAFIQEGETAEESFIPAFDYEGL